MNKQQIELLQRTFARIESVAEEAGEVFYYRLFDIDPTLRPMFKGDIKTQGKMFMTAIGLTVKGLDHPETVEPQLAEIGRRHTRYGATPADFDKFGAALQWSFEHTLGEDYTEPVKEAWAEAFEFITRGMKAATDANVAAID